MGEFLVKLQPVELQACRNSLKIIRDKAEDFGLLKRGHQHLWNDLADKYNIVGKKIEIDYETGLVMERSEPDEVKTDG